MCSFTFAATPLQGRPVGSLRLGRRFTAEELAQVAAGVPVDAVVETAGVLPPPLTREEMYASLFG